MTQPLPFFPTPYPDECIYSILSRYYDQTGKLNAIDIKERLFGRRLSLTPSIASPDFAQYCDRWYDPKTGVSKRELQLRHTVFSFCAVSPRDSFRVTCERLTHLKYCPACASEEIRIYGEPYWHLLHQIDHVEYCPSHQVPLVKSEAEVSCTASKFYSAYSSIKMDETDSSALAKNGANSSEISDSDNKIIRYRKEYFHLLNDIIFLKKHGGLFVSNAVLTEKYKRVLLPYMRGKTTASLLGKKLTDSISAIVDTDFLHTVIPPKNTLRSWGGSFDSIDSFHAFTPSQHALMMGLMYGSAQAFYDEMYKNDRLYPRQPFDEKY